jgi:c-di-GMP-binding flagellar brake protein YcgR
VTGRWCGAGAGAERSKTGAAPGHLGTARGGRREGAARRAEIRTKPAALRLSDGSGQRGSRGIIDRMDVHDYDRFRVEDGAEVLALLRETAAARVLCSVRAAGRPETYLSPLRELSDDGAPVLDAPRAPVIERALVPGSLAAIDLRLRDCRVSFEARVDRLAPGGGRPGLRLARPEAMTRLQRRETYRVQVPEGIALKLTLDPQDPSLRDVPLHDLSVQGGSLSVTGVRERFEAGRSFEHARLALPDGTEWAIGLRVIHAGFVRRLADGSRMRLGVQFVQPAQGFETAVARLVGAIARGQAATPRG